MGSFSGTMRTLGSILLLAAVSGGCTTARVLPPRVAPAPTLPHVVFPNEPIAPGNARVVVEAVDGPMDLFARGTSAENANAKLSCRTPCVADLPVGRYDLFFSNLASDAARGDRAKVALRDGLNVVRQAPGQYRVPAAFQWPSFTLAVGGGALVFGGLVVASGNERDASVPGIALLSLGVGALIASLAVYQYVAEQQAGATTSFVVDDRFEPEMDE